MKIKIIELFSGIGGFTKGLNDAGFDIVEHYYSEIDKHSIANYKYNFQNAKYIGDVKSIQSGDFKGIDIITFGSPCQDFSLAGKRKGLDGERSSLIQHAIDLVTDIRPSVFIWENVKGAFSSNSGADLWAILQAFTNIGGYRLEWQLLNTKWVLPQNRERIYLIGHLAERSSPGVFPITEAGQPCHESRTDEGKVHADNRTALTQLARQFSSLNGDYIKVNGLSTEQMLEINENCISNTLTSVQKDNIVVGTYRTHKNDKGLRKISDGSCPTIPARGRKDGSGQPVICDNISIRRLTEIECERLQGFPDDFTKYGNYDGVIKEIPKTQRYKMLGNAVTTNIVKLIGVRLLKLMNK